MAEPAPEEAPARPYQVGLALEYRKLAVTDEDPENDHSLVWQLQAQGEVFERARAFMSMGMVERLVAEDDESGVKLQDAKVGLAYLTPVALGEVGDLTLLHEAAVYLPTSRASQNQDLYLAPQYLLRAITPELYGLTLTLEPRVRYRFHAYAERAGLEGGMNTRLDFGVRLGLDYAIWEFDRFGAIGVGVSAGTTWLRRYDARDDYESSASDAGLWLQSYDWEAHLTYDPLEFLSLYASVEHGGDVLRDGVVNTFLTHRDETELVFGLQAQY